MRKRGGGLCLYINKKLKANAQIYEELARSDKNIELAVLQVQQPCTTPFTLVSVYRPPQGDQQEFLKDLRETLHNIDDKDNIVVLGDLNIDF